MSKDNATDVFASLLKEAYGDISDLRKEVKKAEKMRDQAMRAYSDSLLFGDELGEQLQDAKSKIAELEQRCAAAEQSAAETAANLLRANMEILNFQKLLSRESTIIPATINLDYENVKK